jgi:predicted nucleic acid-binding Zn ribbon protein
MPAIETKNCLACGKPVKGRVDKKFCDDYCRNNYNNLQKAKSSHSSLVRNINNALLKNRKILEAILPDNAETTRTSRDKLLQQGFQFKYFTQIYIAKNGNVYHYCYDYGYRELENDYYMIVRNKEE